MKNKVFANHVLLFIFIQAFSASVFAAPQADIDLNQALEEAKDFCQKKVDPMIASMAKQAGYDVEKLCQSLNQLSLSAEQSLEQAEVPKRSDGPKENQQQQGDHQPSLEPSTIQGGEQSNLPKNTPLKLFGYDLFAGEPDTFEPIANAPVELDYLLGPGDELNIQFYGKVNDYFEQTILRDGTINFPKIGPVGVAGMSYTEAKQLINRKVAEEYIGVKVSVSLGSLRSMQIFVFGEAYKPGRYTVPSLSTITNALYLSGGVSEIASLRNIQIKRNGKIQARLDLYDLLLSGDRSKDIRLQSGDTIFIPAVGQTAGIEGQVRRPAIYELMQKPTVGVLIDLAGGAFAQSLSAQG
ncbi:MAG: polysaccharide biosynthesis/export family protein [Porticoccaceae bacterium]